MLTSEAATDPRTALGQLRDRLQVPNIPGNVMRELFGLTFVLCGLRYEPAQIEAFCRELSMTLEDSSTYQLILQRGIAQGITHNAQGVLLLQGHKRFGPASDAAEAAIHAITDQARLNRMA